MLEPRSGPELVELLRTVTMPVSNLVWADRHGSIGYKMMGRIPKRKGDCPDLPKPGWTGEFEWDGWIPYDELPELVDPEQGFIVTANNRVVDSSYPHHITSDWLDGYRAARIEQLLQETEEHDLDELQSRFRPTSIRSPVTRSSTGWRAWSRPASARPARSSA